MLPEIQTGLLPERIAAVPTPGPPRTSWAPMALKVKLVPAGGTKVTSMYPVAEPLTVIVSGWTLAEP